MKITKDTKLIEVIKSSKAVKGVFQKYGLDCIGCRGAEEDTVEKAAINNGLDLKTFIKELSSAMDK